MADQPIQRNVPRPADSGGSVPRPADSGGSVPRPTAPEFQSRPSAPTSDPDSVSHSTEPTPIDRSVAQNSEHTLEAQLAESETPVVVYCECSNARCSGHFRRSFCTGTAAKGLVRSNRPDDPMMVLCPICYQLTMEADADLWRDVDGAMDKYHAAQVELDPAEEARRAARLSETIRAAREEGAPATAPALSVESVRAAQLPQRDTTVEVLDDSYQTTSQIPTLEPEEKK